MAGGPEEQGERLLWHSAALCISAKLQFNRVTVGHRLHTLFAEFIFTGDVDLANQQSATRRGRRIEASLRLQPATTTWRDARHRRGDRAVDWRDVSLGMA